MLSSVKIHPSLKMSEFNIVFKQAHTRPVVRPTLLKQLKWKDHINDGWDD